MVVIALFYIQTLLGEALPAHGVAMDLKGDDFNILQNETREFD